MGLFVLLLLIVNELLVLAVIAAIIKAIFGSNMLTRKPETLQKVREFLAKVANSEECWPLLGFYYQLFDYVNKTHYLWLYGTGTTGFSIKLRTKKGQTISLCTLWNSKTIAFKVNR